ncbi:MAG: hypothetical protein WCR74_16670 [Betaproteobacteria bacterium]
MLAGLAAVGSASAADEMIAFGKQTGQINLGLYRHKMYTKALGSESVIGGATLHGISGEKSLGLDQTMSAALLDGFWRFCRPSPRVRRLLQA